MPQYSIQQSKLLTVRDINATFEKRLVHYIPNKQQKVNSLVTEN